MQNIVTVGKVYHKSTYGDADRNVLGGKSKSICRTCIYSSEKTSSPSPWWKRSNIINHQQMAGWLPQRTEAYRALHVGLCIWQIKHSAVTSASQSCYSSNNILIVEAINSLQPCQHGHFFMGSLNKLKVTTERSWLMATVPFVLCTHWQISFTTDTLWKAFTFWRQAEVHPRALFLDLPDTILQIVFIPNHYPDKTLAPAK